MSRLDLPAAALRRVLREGYSKQDLKADLLAGVVVGIVALPLSMALAIASGVAPQQGLYTAIVAGSAIALLGGSRYQVSGPTAAFVVILAPIVGKFGVGGLLVATLMAGLLLMALGLLGLGRLLRFVPEAVTRGFTAGIGVVIATLQLKDLLGLTTGKLPETYLGKVSALAHALPTLRLGDFGVGALTLLVLLVWPRVTRRVPAPLMALLLGAAVAYALGRLGLGATTIDSRFGDLTNGRPGIPQLPPLLALPWSFPGSDGTPLGLSMPLFESLALPAISIALLGAIESLLSAVVADGMTGTRHDPNAELFAQGVGNVIAPFFGGIAATGAIARTATNIRSGARSPVASLVHAAFVLAAVLLFAPLLGYLPMASLAALLLLVAWNMSEAHHFVRMLKSGEAREVFILLVCFGLTVVFDMVVSVTTGVLLSLVLPKPSPAPAGSPPG